MALKACTKACSAKGPLLGLVVLEGYTLTSKNQDIPRYTGSGPKSARTDFKVSKSKKETKPTATKSPVKSAKVENAIARRNALTVKQAKMPEQKKIVVKQSSKTLNVNKGPRFPNAGATTQLHFPNKSNKVHENLKSCSPWYQSISDPLHGADCKIPDDCGDETGTLQCVVKGQITVPAIPQASCGVQINTPYSCLLGLPIQGYSLSTGASTTAVLAWQPGQQYPTSPVLISYAQGHRVVSAALYVQPECSLVDCSGEMTFFQTPMDKDGNSTYDWFVNKYGSTTMALNSLDPMMIRWFPYSDQDKTFKAFYLPNAGNVGFFDDAVPYWQMGFITAGVPAGVTFRWTIVINYEFLPLYNAVNILDLAPSPTDATETDLVETWIATEPTAKPLTQVQMVEPPRAVQPQHSEGDGGGFGMFTDVLRELVPIALEGLSLFI